MSNVPVLKELVSAVAFDPSLKLAVENDFVQIINEKQTQGDVTVAIEYLILDAGHISLFFRVDAPVKAGTYYYDFTNSGTQEFTAGIVNDTMYKSGTLEELKIEFVDGGNIPKVINFGLTTHVDLNFLETRSVEVSAEGVPPSPHPEASGIDYEFKFTILIDWLFWM